jgi:hypothetical protein
MEGIAKSLGNMEARMNQLFQTMLVSKQWTAEIALAVVSLHVEAGEIAKAQTSQERKRALRSFFRRKRVLEKTLGQLVDKKEAKNDERKNQTSTRGDTEEVQEQ